MSLSNAAGAFFVYKFLRKLTTDWEDMDAFKYGIIDDKGKVLRKTRDLKTAEEKESYTLFDRLAFNIKRTIEMLPGGRSKLASYATALYLLRENFNFNDDEFEQVFAELGMDLNDTLVENTNTWIVTEGKLGQGEYKLTYDIASPITGEIVGKKNHKIVVESVIDPIDTVLGQSIYKVKHMISGQDLYVTAQDLKR